ncbi:MAG TPA: hypothetical protein VMW72_09380 [Sedimentisphaerales bacterium]|nr:hypothetical protein [Sedimentisphaerales bacterium]
MNLVRWFRKNNTKVMAVVVIVIMFGFIGGGTLLQQLSRRATGLHKTIAYFGDNKKITNNDLYLARRELDILRSLAADVLLRNQDLRGILLGELLFAEQQTSPALINHIRQTIRTNRYRISDKQINDMYRRSVPSNIYWLLLKNEAQLAGIRVPNEQAGELLGQVIPQLFNGQTYSQRIGALRDQYGLPEPQLLTIFSDLLAVMQYAQMICSNEDVTSSQISQAIATEQESIDAELVEFNPTVFADDQAQISNEEMLEHFNKYKKFLPSAVSEENPYGFGYKLPDRVQLEYIVVRLDDISPLITPPTQQQKEDYYQRNREQLFTEQVPSNPNDPNSPLKQETKSYAEVSDIISDRLLKDKINSTANRILQEAKTITEASLEDTDIEPANLTDEHFKEKAGDYKTTAEQLSEKHNFKLYAGRTGLLSPIDMQIDEYLARLYVDGYGQNPVSLAQIVFAVGDLAASELGPFDVQKSRMYENIGPLKDLWGSPWSGLQDVSGQIMAIVRVIKTIKAAEPQSIDQTFSTSTLEFDPNKPSALGGAEGEDAAENIYSVKEKVTEDLKKLAAMDITKSKAEEFIGLAAKDGWDSVIDKFNELYGQKNSQDPNDPNASEISIAEKSVTEPFKLQNLAGMRRISKVTLQTLTAQSAGRPAAPFFINERRKQRRFVEQLYSLIPQDSNTVDAVPLVIEFRPDMSFYCIKNISVKRITLQEYEKTKAMQIQREDHTQSESLAAVYFNPENILKRMSFRPAPASNKQGPAGAGEEPADANTPTPPGEARRSTTESEATL